MTNVHIYLKRGDFVTPSEGEVWIYPFKRVNATGFFVLPDPVVVALVDGQATVSLQPSGVDWAWYVDENVPAGIKRLVAVPNSGTTLEYDDLVDVDPTTLTAASAPVAGWWAVANQNVIGASVAGDFLTFTRFDGTTIGPFNVRGPVGTITPADLSQFYTLGNVSGTLNLSSYTNGGVFHLTLTGNITSITLPAQSSTYQRVFELVITQDATGGRTITWPTHVSSDTVDPVLTIIGSAIDVIALVQDGVRVQLRQVGRALG
jgi:hypothetical protein